eukprot:365228-Chlamydomonas_euryale.AAC.46
MLEPVAKAHSRGPVAKAMVETDPPSLPDLLCQIAAPPLFTPFRATHVALCARAPRLKAACTPRPELAAPRCARKRPWGEPGSSSQSITPAGIGPYRTAETPPPLRA